eukprot:TRINITY_DN69_c0_g2_i1.p1 TRINITY_DN69_c0_g2~~TRINITY_DN69_c0_g2_i1.p1  ORF type:complete len:1010 (+),score=378.53 TRINITY_DN69_c0_g2_i1:73-3102(+)
MELNVDRLKAVITDFALNHKQNIVQNLVCVKDGDEFADVFFNWLLGDVSGPGVFILNAKVCIIACEGGDSLEKVDLSSLKLQPRMKVSEFPEENIAEFIGNQMDMGGKKTVFLTAKNAEISTGLKAKEMIIKKGYSLISMSLAKLGKQGKTSLARCSKVLVDIMKKAYAEGIEYADMEEGQTYEQFVEKYLMVHAKDYFDQGFSLKLANPNGDKAIDKSAMYLELEGCMKGIHVSVGRTFIYEASRQIGEAYGHLLACRDAVQKQFRKESCKLKDINEVIFKTLPPQYHPQWEMKAKKMVRDRQTKKMQEAILNVCGHVSGVLSSDLDKPIRSDKLFRLLADTVFNLRLGLRLPADNGSSVVLLLKDTFIVQKRKNGLIINNLTSEISSDLPDIFNQNVPSESEDELNDTNVERLKPTTRGMRRRNEEIQNNDEAEALRIRQMEIREEKARQALEGEKKVTAKKIEAKEIKAYNSSAEFPSIVSHDRISVVKRDRTVFLPINNTPTPFDVVCMKSVRMNEDVVGKNRTFEYNLTFFGPTDTSSKAIPLSMSAAAKSNLDKVYIKRVTLSSSSGEHLTSVFRETKKLISDSREADKQKEEEQTLVHQERLEIFRGRKAKSMLDLEISPKISGRKTQGRLEIQQNGVRYVSSKREVVDVIYRNIRSIFLQPASVGSTKSIIHLSLRNAIMVGKKKFTQISFFTDVVSSSQDTNDRRRGMQGRDEFEEQERDLKLVKMVNSKFKKFCRNIRDQSREHAKETGKGDGIDVDGPNPSLHFDACLVTGRMDRVYTTTTALISITETPPMVIFLDDIMHIHFERVNSTNRTFDIAIVFKSGKGKAAGFEKLTAIERKHVNVLKKYFTEYDISLTESSRPFDWGEAIKVVRSPHFFKNVDEDGNPKLVGFLFFDDEAHRELVDGDGEGDTSAFSEDIYSEDEESEFDEDEFDEDEESSDQDEEFDDDDDDDEIADWDELAKQAHKDDRKRTYYTEDKRDHKLSKKRLAPPKKRRRVQ